MTQKLVPPCAYQGGKQRIAKDIVDIILKDNPQLLNDEDDTYFYDLCCGSGAISIEMVNRGVNPLKITMIDASPWGLFWKTIGDGTFNIEIFKRYIDNVPKDKFKIQEHIINLCKNPSANDLVYEFLLLQATSFGSKSIWWDKTKWCTSWFRNYWQPNGIAKRKSPVNPMIPMPDVIFDRVLNLYKKMSGLSGYWDDCNNINININSVIYIDPPYNNTTGYGFLFNYMEFIHRNNDNNTIFLSEGIKISDIAFKIRGKTEKGGISGERKSSNEEWLNVFVV